MLFSPWTSQALMPDLCELGLDLKCLLVLIVHTAPLSVSIPVSASCYILSLPNSLLPFTLSLCPPLLFPLLPPLPLPLVSFHITLFVCKPWAVYVLNTLATCSFYLTTERRACFFSIFLLIWSFLLVCAETGGIAKWNRSRDIKYSPNGPRPACQTEVWNDNYPHALWIMLKWPCPVLQERVKVIGIIYDTISFPQHYTRSH